MRVLLAFTVAACGLALLGVYGPSLQGPFLFDDLQAYGGQIDNVSLPNWHQWLLPLSRPAVQSWHSLIERLPIESSFVLRVAGVIIHLVNGILVYLLVAKIHLSLASGSAASNVNPKIIAAAISILWLLHPVCVQTVCSVIQQAESMMSSLFLGYLLFIASVPEQRPFRKAIFGYLILVLGIYTKLVIVSVVPVGLVLDAVISRDSMRSTMKRKWWIHLAPTIPAALLVLMLIPQLLRAESGVGFGGDAPPVEVYLMSSMRAVAIYAGLALWPAELAIDRGPDFVTTWTDAAPYAVGIFVYIYIAIGLWRRRAGDREFNRLLSWLMVTPLLVLSVTNSVIPTADPVFEHRFYLPLLFLIWCLVLLGWRSINQFQVHQEPAKWMSIAFYILIASVFGVRSHWRARDYASAEQAWRSALVVDPNNARAAQNFVAALQEAKKDVAVEHELVELIKMADHRGRNFDALVHQLAKEVLNQGNGNGSLVMLRELTKRQFSFDTLLTDRERREFGELWFDLAVAYTRVNRPDLAVSAIKNALIATPRDPIAHQFAGDLYSQVGNNELAYKHFKLAEEFAKNISRD